MIIYNVTVKIEASSAEEWLQWMKTEHLPDLMNTGLFTEYKLCRLLEQDENEGVTFIVQYFCPSKKEYETYIDQHATTMREKGIQRFGNRFIAFRTLMETV
ncbi:MAG: DUF4286 family protein [Bacteroidetes bacterium]|nr:DUF4286 family protein [Bacteroidota bacterium]